MTKEQCEKCVYATKCDGVLHFKSSRLNITCGQDRAKVAKKPKPKAAKTEKGTPPKKQIVTGSGLADVASYKLVLKEEGITDPMK